MNLNIKLVGEIPANSYAVLERTSDTSAPGAAFLIYTGALVNTGATLRLLRADSSLVDQVPGGENWVNIGGDNVTKETAQYTEKGWKTAAATPGYGLVWSGEEVIESEPVVESAASTKTVAAKKSSSADESVKLTLPGVTLLLEVLAKKTAYVNQLVSFDVKPSGVGEVLLSSLLYQWNFGDGFGSKEKTTEHVFEYPGTYVVTVYAGFKRQEQVARHEITVLPVKISLTTNRDGDLQINNDSPYELNISNYRLRSDKEFIFPAYSILLANQTITIPKKELGQTKVGLVVLYDTENSVVTYLKPNITVSDDVFFSTANYSSANKPAVISYRSPTNEGSDFAFSTGIPADLKQTEDFVPPVKVTSTQSAAILDSIPEPKSDSGYLSLVGILVIGIIGIYAIPRRKE